MSDPQAEQYQLVLSLKAVVSAIEEQHRVMLENREGFNTYQGAARDISTLKTQASLIQSLLRNLRADG